MLEEKSQGIVLRSIDYKDSQRIISLFTYEQGLISIIVKGISRKNLRLLALTAPFTEIETVYKKGRSDLYLFADGSILDDHLELRKSLECLTTAGHLAHAILTSQLPGKPVPELYLLFRAYFKQIATFTDPSPLVPSFQLKLLKHEGLLALAAYCNHCTHQAAHFLRKGESLCANHRFSDLFAFSLEEWALLLKLNSAEQFSHLRTNPVPAALKQKINTYFQARIADPV